MHEPVLLEAVMGALAVGAGDTVVDGTAGGGGHTEALLEAVGADGHVLAFDRDAEALDRVLKRLKGMPGRLTPVHADYRTLAEELKARGIASVDGVLLDVGISSNQLDAPGRGFGFREDGPLDMRMNRDDSLTAGELVNTLPEDALRGLIQRFGEDRSARRIAAAIVAERARAPLTSTRQLAELIERVKPRRGARIHPATQTFQALRIAVNDELGALGAGVEAALGCLRPGGRLAVIAFHSLEDRIVKHLIREHEGIWEAQPEGGEIWRGRLPPVRRITRKPVLPEAEEVERNPRARSARLRVAERLEWRACAEGR